MDELSQQLERILSDPAQMAQISALADSLGLRGDTPQAEASAEAPEPQDELQALGKLLPLLRQSTSREAQLFQAIRPYLSPENRQRADRAMRAARLSRLARTALQQLGDGGLL